MTGGGISRTSPSPSPASSPEPQGHPPPQPHGVSLDGAPGDPGCASSSLRNLNLGPVAAQGQSSPAGRPACQSAPRGLSVLEATPSCAARQGTHSCLLQPGSAEAEAGGLQSLTAGGRGGRSLDCRRLRGRDASPGPGAGHPHPGACHRPPASATQPGHSAASRGHHPAIPAARQRTCFS